VTGLFARSVWSKGRPSLEHSGALLVTVTSTFAGAPDSTLSAA
jgi:hypothetical protein